MSLGSKDTLTKTNSNKKSNDDILQLPTDRERTDTSAREALDTKSD